MFSVHWGVLKYLILNDGGSKEYFTINVLGGEILKNEVGGGDFSWSASFSGP